MACSVGMLVFNKLAVGAFPLSCALVGLQMAFTVLALAACTPGSIRIGSLGDALRWIVVVPFFTGMLLTSILALEHAPMTLVVTLRAVAPLMGMAVERFLYPTPLRVSASMLASLGIMLVGGLLYARDIDHSSFVGVKWTVLNNMLASLDRLLQRYMLAADQRPVDISTSGCTLLNNLLGIVPILLTAAWTSELGKVPGALSALDPWGAAWIAASCVVGAGISYSGVWVQSIISATSFLVLVNANKFVIVFLEVFALRSKSVTPLQALGALVTILGGAAFGAAREALGDRAGGDESSSEEGSSESSFLPSARCR